MRIGCLQFEPQHGAVDPNMGKASRMLDKKSIVARSQLDFLVLPRLAFLRSDFDPKRLKYYFEPAGGLGTRLWAQTAAIKYNCHVVAGYPQKVDDYSARYTREQFFSSSIIVSRDGMDIENCPERTLDRESPIFSEVGFTESQVSIAQCKSETTMTVTRRSADFLFALGYRADTDLGDDEEPNAKERRAFVDHIRTSGINIAIFSMACKSRRRQYELSDKWDEDALSRWAAYLWPVVEAELDREIIVVFCNRVGDAGDAIYAGTSAVLSISDGELFVHELMKGREEGILLVETCEAPKYKLVPAQSCLDGVFPVHTSEDLKYKLVSVQEGVDYEQELDDESMSSADSPQAGSPTPDTSNLGSDTAQKLSQTKRHAPDTVCSSSNQEALLADGAHPAVGIAVQHSIATRQPRPKLEIPKSTFESPQEISVAEYKARAAAISRFGVSATAVRSPEASTPHPGGARQRWQGFPGSRRYTLRTLRQPAPDATAAGLENPKTAISSSPQCCTGQWPTVAGNGSRTRQDSSSAFRESEQSQAGLGRSHRLAAPTVVSASDSSSRRDAPAIQRPTSPKSRQVKVLDSLKASIDATTCGVIPILVSPSIMTTTTGSQTGRDSTRPRGRSRSQRQPAEEDARSSSRDSTCHGLLHRRVRYSCDGDEARRAGGQRSQSTSAARTRAGPRSASLPAVRNGRGRDAGAVLGAKARRSGSRSRPVPKMTSQ